MSGINTSGVPNTQDYVLGRGAIYLGVLSATGIPEEYRHVGNVPAFTITMEVESLEHQSSLEGLKTIDLEVIVSQKASFSFSFDELNFDNLALFMSGETSTYANSVAIAGFAERTLIAANEGVLGRWYDIVDGSGNRVYNIADTNVAVESPNATVKTLNTDYLIDEFAGRIFLVPAADGGTINVTNAILVTLSATAAAGTVDQVLALTQSNTRVALKFIGENPADDDVQVEVQIHKCQLKADGDLAMIGDEFAVASLTGVAEKNLTADATSPYIRIRALTVAG